MIDEPRLVLTVVCALGCGVAGGVFFAFSALVMKALAGLPPSGGVAAMQSINAAAPTPLFMALLFGTAGGCVLLAIASLLRWDEPAAAYQVVGSVLYLAVVVITIAYHVPRNDALATVEPSSAEAARRWAHDASGWTAWNHVRTGLSVAAAATLTVALRVG